MFWLVIYLQTGPSSPVMDAIQTRFFQVGFADIEVNVRRSVLVSFLKASFDVRSNIGYIAKDPQ